MWYFVWPLVWSQLLLEKEGSSYPLGGRQKTKKIPRALFGMASTQGSIWRHFFCRRVSSSLAPRAFYAAPLAAPGWTPLLGLFFLPRQKYNLELEFLADFHLFCTKIAANFSNSKSVASTKSYACSTEPHFHPSEMRFLGPTHLTFLPGKLARSKLFG